MEFQLELLKRLKLYLEENKKEQELYEKAKKKKHQKLILTDDENRAWYNSGWLHSKTSIKRIRIELNKSLIELGL